VSAHHRPTVLFLCVHNAGRSQMALGWFEHLARGPAVAWSGGSEPATEINRSAVAAMREVIGEWMSRGSVTRIE
jgi:arsenate reductase (thioredoxin)